MDAVKNCSKKYIPSEDWVKGNKEWQDQIAKGDSFRCLMRIMYRLKLADVSVFQNCVIDHKTQRYFELNGCMFPKH